MNPINKILVYVDDSDESIAASQYAILLAKAMGVKLTALFVINTKALQDLLKAKIFISSEQQEYEHDMREDGNRYLNLVKKMATSKNVEIETILKEGTPHIEIKDLTESIKPDVLVIGSENHKIKSLREELVTEKEHAARIVRCNVILIKDVDKIETMFENDNINI